jgi:hypothetical protein
LLRGPNFNPMVAAEGVWLLDFGLKGSHLAYRLSPGNIFGEMALIRLRAMLRP